MYAAADPISGIRLTHFQNALDVLPDRLVAFEQKRHDEGMWCPDLYAIVHTIPALNGV